MNTVSIVGAGLSGMTAGIILARKGKKVLIHDAFSGPGGSPALHPSAHTTPVQMAELKRYTGLDLDRFFHKCDPYPAILYKSRPLILPAYVKQNKAFCIERGPRPSSFDNGLYDMACESGVEFRFNDRVDISSADGGTIIATGLDPDGYRGFGIPFRRVYGSWSYRESSDAAVTGDIFIGPFSTDYGYTARVNGLDYALLFSRKKLRVTDVDGFRRSVRKAGRGSWDGPWKSVEMAVPAAPVLFAGGCIMAGTLSGMIEPFWGYGVVGALISGKIAATAVDDPEQAERDFADFTSGFRKKFQRREDLSSHSPAVMGLMVRAGIWYARLRCRLNRELAAGQREPLRWFRP